MSKQSTEDVTAPPPLGSLQRVDGVLPGLEDMQAQIRSWKQRRLAEPLPPAVAEFAASELEEAQQADQIGYYARLLVQVTLPHSRVVGSEYERRNGDLVLTLLAPSKIGLPYGSLPRLLLAWVTAEAVRTRERELVLGNTLSEFMEELELVKIGSRPSGGQWGAIPRLRQQMTRLFATTISVVNTGRANVVGLKNATVADDALIFWDPKRPSQAALWHSTVVLSERFYESVTTRPVPVSRAALKYLRRSPLALDLYAFCTWRMSYLRRPLPLPWEAVRGQFGSGIARPVDFRVKVREALVKVKTVYPELQAEVTTDALWLYPSPTHVPPRALTN